MKRFTIAALMILIATSVHAFDLRFQPSDVVYVYENSGEGTPADMYTAVLHNVAFVNDSDGAVTIDLARIEVVKDGVVLQSQLIAGDVLAQAAQKFHAYQEAGALDMYDFHFQTSRYLEGVKFASSTTLEPGEAIVVQAQTLIFSGLPDEVVVVAGGHDAEGAPVSAKGRLKVINHHSPNEYFFPVRGRWLAAAAPSLHSHHRWAGIQEFAIDLVQLGEGGLSHSGDGTRLDQFHAYGEQIYAIGDGVVVAALGTMIESNDNLQQPEESDEAYAGRSMAAQQELLAQGFTKVLGNHVIIEHPHGEYSCYVHLQHNSVDVAVGDKVTRGQPIARLGHSGNSTEPHLHFHLADGSDLAHSRSLPVEFKNISLWPSDDGTVRHIHSGQVVIAKE